VQLQALQQRRRRARAPETLTGSEVPLRSFAARFLPCSARQLALLRGEHRTRTLSTFARNTRPGFACSIARFGLPWRLGGTLVGVDVCPLVELGCLKRVGSDSLLVKGGRGILATGMAYGDCMRRPWLCGTCGLGCRGQDCLMCRAADGQSASSMHAGSSSGVS
jgi:hypothetical protein